MRYLWVSLLLVGIILVVGIEGKGHSMKRGLESSYESVRVRRTAGEEPPKPPKLILKILVPRRNGDSTYQLIPIAIVELRQPGPYYISLQQSQRVSDHVGYIRARRHAGEEDVPKEVMSADEEPPKVRARRHADEEKPPVHLQKIRQRRQMPQLPPPPEGMSIPPYLENLRNHF